MWVEKNNLFMAIIRIFFLIEDRQIFIAVFYNSIFGWPCTYTHKQIHQWRKKNPLVTVQSKRDGGGRGSVVDTVDSEAQLGCEGLGRAEEVHPVCVCVCVSGARTHPLCRQSIDPRPLWQTKPATHTPHTSELVGTYSLIIKKLVLT